MNPERALQIRDRIRENTREILLCCPRGHFIAHIALWVPEDTGMLVMRPRGNAKQYVGDVHEGCAGQPDRFRVSGVFLGGRRERVLVVL